jgi:hypothetical protein
MVILSLCGDKYNHPSDKPEDLTLLDRAWKRAVAHFKQDNNSAAKRPAAVGGAARTAA